VKTEAALPRQHAVHRLLVHTHGVSSDALRSIGFVSYIEHRTSCVTFLVFQVSGAVFCTLGFEVGEGWSGRTLLAGGQGAVCLCLPLKSWAAIVEGLPGDIFASIRSR
jgi:hypothetical protein